MITERMAPCDHELLSIAFDYPRWKEYRVKISNFSTFEKHKELLSEMVASSKEYYGDYE